MPFTLAHPAAVLPLRRFSPRFLSLSALVVGSVAPDAGYCFGRWHLENFSHTIVGIFGFSLPIGLAMLGFFYALRGRVVEWLPSNERRIFEPLCKSPPPPFWMLCFSLVIGAATHLLLDSFTHANSWLVQHVNLLRLPIMKIGYRQLVLCHVLGYVCSFAGVAWVCYAYAKWHQKVSPQSQREFSPWLKPLMLGLLVLPIEFLHHFVRNPMGFAVVGLCSLALLLWATLNLGTQLPGHQKEL